MFTSKPYEKAFKSILKMIDLNAFLLNLFHAQTIFSNKKADWYTDDFHFYILLRPLLFFRRILV